MDSKLLKFDIAVLGSGPAGLQAAIHSSRRKLRVVVVGRIERSSVSRAHIDNYCCLDHIQNGMQMLETGVKQAERSGAEFVKEDVVKLEKEDDIFDIRTEGGSQIEAKAIVFALGVSHTKLNVPGEKEMLGKGVSYCADCDAIFFKDKTVAVVGGRSAAGSAAIHLSAYARKVYLISDKLEVDQKLASQLNAAKIEILRYPTLKAIKGQTRVDEIEFPDGKSLRADGVFIELGSKGVFELAATLGVAVDPSGYIETNKEQETNMPGVFAAGDIAGPPFQVAKAIGEGCVAGINAADYITKVSEEEKMER